VGLARVGSFALALAVAPAAWADEAAPKRIPIVADRDDDDVNGVADGDQPLLPPSARGDLVPVDPAMVGAALETSGDGEIRIIAGGGGPWPMTKPIPAGAFLQGVRTGEVRIKARGKVIAIADVLGIDFIESNGQGASVDPVKSHASLERTPPAREGDSKDPDALRIRIAIPAGAADPSSVAVESASSAGSAMDTLAQAAVAPAPCAPDLRGVHCFVSAPIRIVVDDVDRTHPLVADRSVRGEVGGALVARVGKANQSIRVEGPRASSAGPIPRLRVAMRPFVVRMTPGGAPAIGGNETGAVAAVRAELAVASATWGQCGVTFGDVQNLEVKVVDPPPAHLLSLGDDVGLPAAGGDIRFRADDKPVSISVPRGAPLDRVAMLLSLAISKAGLVPVLSSNPRIPPGTSGSIDVSVRRRDGSLATLSVVPQAPLSTDPVLSVRIGAVDLSDGLLHFGDIDSMAGTLEERTLVKAFDDGNPLSVEIVIIPFFSGSGRIGESFIGTDSPSMRNVILMDRAGVRARRSSLTLAHELGHVLLNAPDHPDDYGIDTPTLLMDSDASDASAFGPRRLTENECARVVREAGPHARVPLLSRWPLSPLKSR
jgi:hypothetical protein